MSPFISIITVTKNCAPTLERTLASVRELKSLELEYIVIDGVSTDGTLDLLHGSNSVVDQLVSEPDSGIYNAMNKGAARAHGQYILFLNGDDYLLSDGFAQAVFHLKKERPEILSCSSRVMSEDGGAQGSLRPAPAYLRFFNTIPHLSTFVSADLQRKYEFREQYRIAADYDLFLRLYRAGHRFALSDVEVGVHFRGGFSGNVERSQAEIDAIRRENLSVGDYVLSNAIMRVNRWRKRFF